MVCTRHSLPGLPGERRGTERGVFGGGAVPAAGGGPSGSGDGNGDTPVSDGASRDRLRVARSPTWPGGNPRSGDPDLGSARGICGAAHYEAAGRGRSGIRHFRGNATRNLRSARPSPSTTPRRENGPALDQEVRTAGCREAGSLIKRTSGLPRHPASPLAAKPTGRTLLRAPMRAEGSAWTVSGARSQFR